MFLSLNQVQNIFLKQPVKLTNAIGKEYNLLIKKINQREERARKSGITIPGPEILNREGGDATLANNPYLAAVHFGNYLAVKKIIESFIPDKSALAKIHILGIGEGSGVFAYFLSSALKLKSYLATDYQNLLVDYGQKVLGGGPLEFRRVDATTMDSIQNHSFNIVVACEFIEHLTSENLVAFLKECKRVLKKGGIVIATTPNKSCHPGEKFSGYPSHFTEFTAKELNSFIETKILENYKDYLIFHLVNEKICQEKQQGFLLEQRVNQVYRGILRFFQRGSRREKFLSKIIGSLYKISNVLGEKRQRQKLSFPKEYSQTKLVYKPKDETKAFGLCLILQT